MDSGPEVEQVLVGTSGRKPFRRPRFRGPLDPPSEHPLAPKLRQNGDPRVSLTRLSEAADVPRCNAPYDTATIFGERVQVDEQDERTPRICDGIWAAWQELIGDLNVAGSIVTTSQNPEALANLGSQSPLLQSLYLFNQSELPKRYYSGELDLDRLSPVGYFALKLLMNLRGANLDIQGFDERGDPDGTFNDVRKLVRFSYTYPYDGAKRFVSTVNWFDRFKYLHLEEDGSPYSGGINILVSPGNLRGSDPWQHVSTIREMQNQTLARDADGHIAIPPLTETVQEMPLTLLETGDSRGSWLHQTARSIRTMVNQGIPDWQFDTASFRRNQPRTDTDVSFESVIGVAANLMTAFYHDPEKTMHLLDVSGLREELPYFSDEAAEYCIRQYDLIQDSRRPSFFFGIHSPELNRLETALDHAQTELFGGPLRRSSWRFNQNQFTSLQDMAPLILMFCPIELDELDRTIPSVRERVSSVSAGSNALLGYGMEPDDTIVTDAVDVFTRLADGSRDPDRSQQLRDAARAVRDMFRVPDAISS